MKQTRIQWLDTIHDACRDIDDKAYMLQDLAAAFHTTGNDFIAEELSQASSALLLATRRIPMALSEHFSDAFKSEPKE